ncbi:MAG: potassium channel family protein, partial [Deltaproteobacteria bacterium]|nr:potassium channel family protein [Deltaproteobacteria bacterium]
MTLNTVSTIGYTEVIDLSGNAVGQIFIMLLALSGIGVLAYTFSNFTAFIVEGDLKEAFRRRKMEKVVSKYRNHFIVCGAGRVGFYIAQELFATQRRQVLIDTNKDKIEGVLEAFSDRKSCLKWTWVVTSDLPFFVGDATDNSTLLKAGIEEAQGVFAATGDDNQNLVISLTARQLNPQVRAVARCREVGNSDKMKRAGANAVVSTMFIGGLRMASEMVRPEVVSFLDVMLRDKENNLRIEEIPVSPSLTGKRVSDLDLKKFRQTLLLAIRTAKGW